MVIAPVVAAAAPAVVSSATDDEGLINKLFKIGVLIGVLVLATISIIILSWILDIADLLGAGGGALTAIFAKVSLGPIPIIGPIATFLTSAFVFGPRR
jgi:hypothetical protein